jgi:hypothetical protein
MQVDSSKPRLGLTSKHVYIYNSESKFGGTENKKLSILNIRLHKILPQYRTNLCLCFILFPF